MSSLQQGEDSTEIVWLSPPSVFPVWTHDRWRWIFSKSCNGRGPEVRHIHRDRYGRSPAPAASHRPAGKKRMQHAASERSPKRTEAPELPRLRALEAQAAAIPISSSAASSTSPRSGSSRVNPYPVGEATESSPFEIVPSAATQATHSWEQSKP